MDYFQMKCVLAVAKYKNFTRAAEEINVSQSSLSQYISNLEDELGTLLFFRTTREVELLAPGLKFVESAQEIVEKCDTLKQKMEQYAQQARGSISIGGIPIIRAYNTYSMIASFIRSNNNVVVDFIESECFDLVELLKNRKIDVALIHKLDTYDVLNFDELFLDELVIVINRSHQLATRKAIKLNELINETFILPSKDSASCQEFIRECSSIGFEPKILSRCGSVNTIVDFVRENLGVAILSSRVVREYVDSTITITKISPAINRIISVATLKDVHQPPTVRNFIDYAKQWGHANKASSPCRN